MKLWTKLKTYRVPMLPGMPGALSRAEKQTEELMQEGTVKEWREVGRLLDNECFLALMDVAKIDTLLRKENFEAYPNKLLELITAIKQKSV